LQDLSPTVFEALLSSENIQLKTANEAFWLLLAWVEAQSEESEEGKQELFNRMAKHLSFAAMDPGYILLLVSEHPRIIAAGLQHKVMKASLIHSNLARRTREELIAFTRKTCLDFRPMDRRAGQWVCSVRFSAADVVGFEFGDTCEKVAGLVAGIPWHVSLSLDKTFRHLKQLARMSSAPPRTVEVPEARVATACSLPFEWMRHQLDDGVGFYYQYKLEVGVGTPREQTYGDCVKRQWSEEGIVNGAPLAEWKDLFREGSDWLVDGELHVRLTVETIDDQGPSHSA
jgi:hypothetical protein